MTANLVAFENWIRGSFVEMNTTLENLYFEQENPAEVTGIGDYLKQSLVAEGKELIHALVNEGNTDEGFDANFDLLGNVGFYMAACRRHDITEPSRETRSPLVEASSLALQLGASLGLTPRFATCHLTTHAMAIDGVPKRFTHLPDEAIFLDYNTLAVFAYKRAAEAVVQTLPLGISHPVTPNLLDDAVSALEDVAKWNKRLFDELDTDRFFHHVRPYYKPYRVGIHEYRGANAGDFSGINVLDLLLGLCDAADPSYSQLLVDKFLFMMPDDQTRLRDVMRRESLLDSILRSFESKRNQPWFKKLIEVYLRACEAHGHAAAQHHDQLVKRFIEVPSAKLPKENLKGITASGPPLPVLLRSLEKLKDQRVAANRNDIPTRYSDLHKLRQFHNSTSV
ncbi:MAG: hypothetical protein ACI92E_002012 [Oceanicoccus sp.]|jgi:hypothetical protein